MSHGSVFKVGIERDLTGHDFSGISLGKPQKRVWGIFFRLLQVNALLRQMKSQESYFLILREFTPDSNWKRGNSKV
jgi:hypothetical protein